MGVTIANNSGVEVVARVREYNKNYVQKWLNLLESNFCYNYQNVE